MNNLIKDNPNRNIVLIALMLSIMLAAMDSTIVATAIVDIVSDLGGFSKISWVFSIYLLAQTITIPIYGKLADLYGRKSILIFGIFLFLAGSATSAASWNMFTLILFRGIQGLGAGAVMATVNTLAGDLYNLRERAKVQGWLSSMWGLSAILGPAIGGTIVEYTTWRWIFLINIPLGLIAVGLIIIYLHEAFEHQKPQVDYAGSLLIFSSVGLLIVALMEGGQSWAWISLPSFLLVVVAVFLGWRFIKVEERAAEPILPPWIWKRKALIGSTLSMIGMGLVMMGPGTYLPTFIQSSLGLGAILAGFILACESIGWPLASALSGRFYLTIGFRNTGLIGAGLMALASLGFLLIPWPQPVWLLIVDQFFLGAGFGMLSTPMLVGVQSIVGWKERGVVTGTNMFGRYLGQCVGAAIFGAIFNTTFMKEMQGAPVKISTKDNILEMLQSTTLPQNAKHFVEAAINQSMQYIYMGLVVFSLLTFWAVWVTPKHFEIVEDD